MAVPRPIDFYNEELFNNLVCTSSLSSSNTMSIFHVNIRCMKNKLFEINAALQFLNQKFDVLAFTETWFLCEQDVVALVGYETKVFSDHIRKEVLLPFT